MPRVYLSQNQRDDAALEKMKATVVDGLVINKALRRMTNAGIAEAVRINDKTIGRIINGGDPQLTITQVLRLIQFAGLTVGKEIK